MEQPKIHIFNNSRDRIFVPENCTGRIKNLIRTEKNTAPVMRESTGKAQGSDRADTLLAAKVWLMSAVAASGIYRDKS